MLRRGAGALVLAWTFGYTGVANGQATTPEIPEDARQFVEMPPEALALMRQDMLQHLGALTQLVGLVGNGRLQEAADLAESQLGRGAMGRHAATGAPPGRYMPTAMRMMGMSMHDAGSAFAAAARTEDTAASLVALQNIMSSCVGCHAAFRTR